MPRTGRPPLLEPAAVLRDDGTFLPATRDCPDASAPHGTDGSSTPRTDE